MLFSYKTVVRPTIDFASASYHSLLTAEQSMSIEHLQFRAMKVIYGEQVSYRTVVESGRIELLHDRREKLRRNLALRASKSERFADWFPLNIETTHDTRRREKYFVPTLRTERARRSPIIQMRVLLNELEKKKQ